LNELWNSSWGYGGSTKGCIDGFSFRLGKTNVIVIFLSIGIFLFGINVFYKKIKASVECPF